MALTSETRVAAQEFDWATRLLHGKTAYIFVGLAGLALHLLLARPIYAWYDRFGAFVPLAILLILLYRYARQRDKDFPVLLLVALQVYVFYSLPQFTQEALRLRAGIYEPTSFAVTSAVLLVIVGQLAFMLGYAVCYAAAKNRANIFDRILPTPTPRWANVLILYTAISLVVFSLVALKRDFIPVAVRFPLTQIFNVYLALALVLYLRYRFQIARLRLSAVLCVLFMSLVGVVQGSTGNIMAPIIMLFVAGWMWGGTIRKRWFIAVVAGFLVINPVKNEFRRLEFGSEISSFAAIPQRLGTWKLAFENVWVRNNNEFRTLETASRTSDLLSLAQAIDYVPSLVPYNYGEGMGITLIYWIPRVLWTSKVSSTDLLFNRYAVEFGYTTYEGTLTSTTGASAYTEGYWNFGASGIVVFFFTIGVLFGIFFGNGGVRGDVSIIICLVYYASVLLLIQPLILTAPSLITFTVGVWLAMHGLRWLSGVKRPHATEVVRMRPLIGDNQPSR